MAFTIAAPAPRMVLSKAYFPFSASAGKLITSPRYSWLTAMRAPVGSEMTCFALGAASGGGGTGGCYALCGVCAQALKTKTPSPKANHCVSTSADFNKLIAYRHSIFARLH